MAGERVIEFIDSRMQLGTGINKEMTGSSDQRTATGVSMMSQSGNQRQQHKVVLWTPHFRTIYGRLYDLMATHLSDEKALRLEGEDGKYTFTRYGPQDFEAEIDVEIELANTMEPNDQRAQRFMNLYKMIGMDPLVNRQAIIMETLRAMGMKKPKRFLDNPSNHQGDALAENTNFQATGIIGDPRPDENQQVHLQIHMPLMQQPGFQLLPLGRQAMFAKHVQDHMALFQAMQAMQAQSQMASTQPGGAPGASPVGAQANQQAENMFGNAQAGASQQGAEAGPLAGMGMGL
jgi:hypothetical protein